MGYSFKFGGQRVADLLLERLTATIALVGVAQVMAIVCGVLLGIYAGWRRGGALDHSATGMSMALYATPPFWLAMLLVLIFSVVLGWLPGYGAYSPSPVNTGPIDWLVDRVLHLVLPASAIALGLIGQYVLVTRAAMSDVVTEDYMVTARAKGLTGHQMPMRRAFRNAMLPIVTLVSINLGYVVAGAITDLRDILSLEPKGREEEDDAQMQARRRPQAWGAQTRRSDLRCRQGMSIFRHRPCQLLSLADSNQTL